VKTAFAGILNNPANSLNSHSAGWNRLVRSLVDPKAVFVGEDCDWSAFDRIIINHGPNFKPGSFNIIGGIGDAVLMRLEKLAVAFDTAEVYQMDGFNLGDFLQKRLPGRYDFEGEIPLMPLPQRDKLVLGDSHSISVWPGPEYAIERRDGQTLWGFMKDSKPADFLYLGNIDIRFHLCRQENPLKSMHSLLDRYLQFAADCKAKVSCLLPVESETRKIPGTGLYKGQPFYGSQADRALLVNEFNSRLVESGLDVHCWPKTWYENVEQYENEVMEPRQSVHIRPKHYASQI
jgi:hypothetical protein